MNGPDTETVATRPDSRARAFPGGHRIRELEETWALAGRLFDRCGITRVADVTGLDTIGIPVWVAVRPLATTLSVSQGKGMTDVAAKVSAAMEAIELWYAENVSASTALPGRHRAADLGLPYDVTRLQLAARSLFSARVALSWMPAEVVATGETTVVPSDAVAISSLTGPAWTPPLLRITTNGLASGNSRAEAALHALYELVERESTMDLADEPVANRTYVAPESVDDPGCAELIGRIADAGAWLEIVDSTRHPEFPCFVAYLWSADMPSIYAGSGCHGDPAVALSRAVTEAAQSRLTVINGTRDDVRGGLYRSHRWDTQPPVTPPGRVRGWAETVARLSGGPAGDLETRFRHCAELVTGETGQPVLLVPLTPAEQPLAVVRVIAPGLRFTAGDECPRPV